MRKPSYRTILGTLLLAALSLAQQGAQPVVQIEKAMSASDFRSAGLNKLTPEELTVLNGWLSDYAIRVYTAATKSSATEQPAAAVIETQMDDEFNGWDGDTLFKLANGQIWQQASYAYTYHYAYRPKVLIYKSGTVYRMKVDGVDSTIAVKRLK